MTEQQSESLRDTAVRECAEMIRDWESLMLRLSATPLITRCLKWIIPARMR